MSSSVNELLRVAEGNQQVTNPSDYYGKRIAYDELSTIFPEHHVLYTSVEPDEALVGIEQCTIVPWYIGPRGGDSKSAYHELLMQGKRCSIIFTGEVEGVLCFL